MKTRIISGVIGAIFVIIALVLRETIFINFVLGLILALGVYEVQSSTGLVKNKNLILASCLFAFISAFFPVFGFMPTGLLITAIYVFVIVCLILMNSKIYDLYSVTFSIGMTFLISFAMNSVLSINSFDKNTSYISSDCLFLLLITFGGAWFADIGAYFIGSKYGKHKIAPTISPKKSAEGVLGGIGSTVICLFILGLFWNFAILDEKSYVNFWVLLLIALLSPIIGLVGDLFFSVIKRKCDIKDYGNIMPGHGGILDRIDSLIFVAPFVYLVLMYMPIIIHN